MARSNYVYVISAGHRRETILGTFTVKTEMARALRALTQDRSDLLVKRYRDGVIGGGVIMKTDDILKEHP